MAGGKSDTIDVTIRIDKAQATRFDSIVHALEACGLGDVETHPRFLIVNGNVEADRLDKLREVDGVASVRQDQTYRALTR